MKFLGTNKPVIMSYGTSIPALKIFAKEIAAAHDQPEPKSLKITSKSVPSKDQDAATLATDAGFQALQRIADFDAKAAQKIQSLFIGSESHPYAVKPTGTIVASALGLDSRNNKPLALADLQFACKAGTQGLQIVTAYAAAGMIPMGMAIGADTAQAQPGDALEYSAGAGAAAFIIGTGNDGLASIEATTSVATDTPDFWRRPGQVYPRHAGRFTGEPAYFSHVGKAATILMEEVGFGVSDIDFCIFHTPNGKFPRIIAKKLGFSDVQLAPSLIVERIGNTYAAASMLALAAVLDQVGADKTILMVSYGSGAGADAFLIKTTQKLIEARKKWQHFIEDQIAVMKPISYQQYLQQIGSGH
jgi:hydroxymethylglutaryl-CoA synthase